MPSAKKKIAIIVINTWAYGLGLALLKNSKNHNLRAVQDETSRAAKSVIAQFMERWEERKSKNEERGKVAVIEYIVWLRKVGLDNIAKIFPVWLFHSGEMLKVTSSSCTKVKMINLKH